MKRSIPLRVFGLLVLAVASGNIAIAAETAPDVVQLPTMKVKGEKPKPYTLWPAWRNSEMVFLVKELPPSPDFFCVLLPGVMAGDLVVAVNGRKTSTFPLRGFPREFPSEFTLLVQRPTGRKTFREFEVEGRKGASSDR